MQYLVYFSKSNRKWLKGLQLGHVQIGLKSKNAMEYWINLDVDGIDCHHLPSELIESSALHCLKLVVWPLPANKWSLYPNLGTCVTLVKKLLNIHAWWVVTPHQLYKYITKNMAHEVIE